MDQKSPLFSCTEKNEVFSSVEELPKALRKCPTFVENVGLTFHCMGLAVISIHDCVDIDHDDTVTVNDYAVMRFLTEAKTYAEFNGIDGIRLIGLTDPQMQTGDLENAKVSLPGTDKETYIFRPRYGCHDESLDVTGNAITPWPVVNIDALVNRLIAGGVLK